MIKVPNPESLGESPPDYVGKVFEVSSVSSYHNASVFDLLKDSFHIQHATLIWQSRLQARSFHYGLPVVAVFTCVWATCVQMRLCAHKVNSTSEVHLRLALKLPQNRFKGHQGELASGRCVTNTWLKNKQTHTHTHTDMPCRVPNGRQNFSVTEEPGLSKYNRGDRTKNKAAQRRDGNQTLSTHPNHTHVPIKKNR